MIESAQLPTTATVLDYLNHDRDTETAPTTTRQMRLRATFQTPWSDYQEHIGKTFEFLRECNESDGFDEEVLPRYLIRLSDGTEIQVCPEEIDADELWQPEHGPATVPNGT